MTRRSACGHDCAKCGGCGGLETQTLYVTAFNGVAAQVGDRVLLEGETGRVLGIAVLVYLLPVVLFSSATGREACWEAARRRPQSAADSCSHWVYSARCGTAAK